jgi:hypothetical protein
MNGVVDGVRRDRGGEAASVPRLRQLHDGGSAAHYLDELDAESVTRQIDQAVALLGERDDSAVSAVDAGRRLLGATADRW